jgi:hypothetical protein
MVTMPPVMPVTTPVVLMVAMLVLLLLQVPPVAVVLRVSVVPEQIWLKPVIGVDEPTVITLVFVQPYVEV